MLSYDVTFQGSDAVNGAAEISGVGQNTLECVVGKNVCLYKTWQLKQTKTISTVMIYKVYKNSESPFLTRWSRVISVMESRCRGRIKAGWRHSMRSQVSCPLTGTASQL